MPVGPEFQDPPTEKNQPPYFVSPPGGPDGFPFYEQTVTLSGKRQFEAVVGDPNIEQTLSLRFVANYPPVSSATVPLDTQMSGDRSETVPTAPFKITVDCSMFTQGADHNLVAIVSDNGFLDAGADPAALSQVPYNYDQDGRVVVTMTGWRIAGCP